MTAEKHTPGPWVVVSGESLSIRDVATDSRLCTLHWLKGRGGLGGRFSDEEVTANALLFRAAPDMREALRKIAFEPHGHPEATHAEVLEAVTQIARDVIAKTEA